MNAPYSAYHVTQIWSVHPNLWNMPFAPHLLTPLDQLMFWMYLLVYILFIRGCFSKTSQRTRRPEIAETSTSKVQNQLLSSTSIGATDLHHSMSQSSPLVQPEAEPFPGNPSWQQGVTECCLSVAWFRTKICIEGKRMYIFMLRFERHTNVCSHAAHHTMLATITIWFWEVWWKLSHKDVNSSELERRRVWDITGPWP